MPKQNKKMRVPYALSIYGKEEIEAAYKILKTPTRLSVGPLTRKFEETVAKLFGKKFGVMVNSGSSANLLAIEILNLPKGSEVITPLLTFSTTVAPLVQNDLVPVFIDVDPETYVVRLEDVQRAITKKTKAILVPSLIGNIPDFKGLAKLAKKHDLVLIEDSCDTTGAMIDGTPTGSYTDISTTSFYASHILTAAGGGGMIMTHSPTLANRSLMLSRWGRVSTLFKESENVKDRFKEEIGGQAHDAKFIFGEIGYNFQPLELQSAFGLEQAKKLKKYGQLRKKNFKKMSAFFRKYEQYFILPKQLKGVETNWLAFPLTIREGAPFSRMDFVGFLEGENIQTRPVLAGNILAQPAFKDIRHRKAVKIFPAAELIMKSGFLLGVHHGMTEEMFSYMFKTVEKFIKKYE